jgi:hypothetical protein
MNKKENTAINKTKINALDREVEVIVKCIGFLESFKKDYDKKKIDSLEFENWIVKLNEKKIEKVAEFTFTLDSSNFYEALKSLFLFEQSKTSYVIYYLM